MDERERFIRDDRLALYTRTELCDRYGISRKTGYKWLDRFDAGGRAGLRDRSRAPHQCPHRIADEWHRAPMPWQDPLPGGESRQRRKNKLIYRRHRC